MPDSDYKFRIAVVMPVLNEEAFIGGTLEQLYLQDFPMDQVEVIVADGGSTDRTREIVESYRDRFGSLKLLDNPARIASAGRNVGIKNSDAKYILILDGHTYLPDQDLLSSMIEVFEEKGARCLCRPQPLDPPGLSDFETAAAICRASWLGHKPGSDIYSGASREVDPTSSGAMYERSVFDEIGFFDEDFDACEDVDFNFRIHKAGIKAYLSSRLQVFYYPRSNLKGLWKQMVRYGLGRFRFARKHRQLSPIQWLAAAGVAGFGFLLALSFLSTAVFGFLRSVTALYMLIVILFSAYLSLRRSQPACLYFGPLIFPSVHFGLGFGFLCGLLNHFLKK